MRELKYQFEAVDELLKTSNGIIKKGICKTISFKSCTGSGKTIMMFNFLNKFLSDDKICIWMTPNKLHLQAMGSLKKHYSHKDLHPVLLDDLEHNPLEARDVLFLNWESIINKDRIYVRENEKNFNLSSILEKAREDKLKVVLVIDESSYFVSTDNVESIIENLIKADINIEVTATPRSKEDYNISVTRQDVINAGMIAKNVLINNIDDDSNGKENREFLIEQAVNKRNKLKELLIKENSSVNPLILVALPDIKKGNEDVKYDIIDIFKKYGITLENQKLSIYLSNEKINLDDISKNDSKVEVLLFKSAIAKGWDCPRASIMCVFRVFKTWIPSTQTLGRIIRMPERKHYVNDELNNSYVYSTFNITEFKQDQAGPPIDIIKFSKRLKTYKNIDLISTYKVRDFEKTRLSAKFLKVFNDNIDLSKVIIADHVNFEVDSGVVVDIDAGDISDKAKVNIGQLSVYNLRETVNSLIEESIIPFGKNIDSISNICRKLFELLGKIPERKFYATIIQNEALIKKALKQSINKYLEDIEEKKTTIGTYEWNVPHEVPYDKNVKTEICSKCIITPFISKLNKLEESFKSYINDELVSVEWWFKNDDHCSKTTFAIPYMFDGQTKMFLPDWVIKFTDGRIGIFDTKALPEGQHLPDPAKSDALQKYIIDHKNKSVIGGIVIKKDDDWLYYTGTDYEINTQNWKKLKITEDENNGTI